MLTTTFRQFFLMQKKLSLFIIAVITALPVAIQGATVKTTRSIRPTTSPVTRYINLGATFSPMKTTPPWNASSYDSSQRQPQRLLMMPPSSSSATQYLNGVRLTDEQRLMMKLFSNYDRFARPVINLDDPIIISMSLTITQIFELDEKNQVLITNAWANFEWTDEYLHWLPEDYANMVMVRMLSSFLWLPDIVLYNNAADFAPTETSTRAMVSSDGLIFWSVPSKFFSSCKIDVTYFPFDEQICRMKFGSWTYDGFKLDLVNSSTTADMSFYVNSGEWDLISATQRRHVVIYTCCIEPYPDVTFYIHIRRKSLYYYINVVLPCFLMSALTLLVFQLPVESGEKCGLGITIMLSFAVFMLTVIEKLPETSESFPLISIYLSAVLSMTAISICCTVFVSTFNYRSSKTPPPPRWLLRFLNCVAPLCCVHDKHSKPWITSTYPTSMKLTPMEFLRHLSAEMDELAKAQSYYDKLPLNSPEGFYRNFIAGVNRMASGQLREVEDTAANADWRRLAQFIDRSLFWLLLFVISCFTVWIFVFYVPAEQLLGDE